MAEQPAVVRRTDGPESFCRCILCRSRKKKTSRFSLIKKMMCTSCMLMTNSHNHKEHSKYGWLSKMATCSEGSIGSLLASGFCERINSCDTQILTLGNTLLSDGEMEKLVMCCMNQDFMVFIRKNSPKVQTNSSNLEYSKWRTTRRRRMNRELI